ncbi:hypothetical protein V6N11_034559 [Hibiscus sabdariffa]|uniref:Uncharacterized protein n=1 Tax=Hibiscus sabdariffa TaxID=183260 RepID=A0ABR2NH71_9ROSI
MVEASRVEQIVGEKLVKGSCLRIILPLVSYLGSRVSTLEVAWKPGSNVSMWTFIVDVSYGLYRRLLLLEGYFWSC